jgi:2-dehydropantoate 2-reductase
VLPLSALDTPAPDVRFDVVVVAVRSEQLTETLPVLAEMTDAPDVLFLGNTAGHSRALIDGLGDRALFGFPAVGGVRDGAAVRYALIRQQKTTFGEPSGMTSSRLRRLQAVFSADPVEQAQHRGLAARVSRSSCRSHSRCTAPDTDPVRLAHDPVALRLMVRATRQAFRALRTAHVVEIPTNLTILYLRMPEQFAVRYWQRVFASPRGELWFAGHSRGAAREMASLRDELLDAVHRTGKPTPDLDVLLAPG